MQFIQIPIPTEVFGDQDMRGLKIITKRLAEALMNIERTVAEHNRLIRLADEKFKQLDTRTSELNETVESIQGRIEPLEKKEVLREQKRLRDEEINVLKSKVSELEKKIT